MLAWRLGLGSENNWSLCSPYPPGFQSENQELHQHPWCLSLRIRGACHPLSIRGACHSGSMVPVTHSLPHFLFSTLAENLAVFVQRLLTPCLAKLQYVKSALVLIPDLSTQNKTKKTKMTTVSRCRGFSFIPLLWRIASLPVAGKSCS
jgi:hypothetical protein